MPCRSRLTQQAHSQNSDPWLIMFPNQFQAARCRRGEGRGGLHRLVVDLKSWPQMISFFFFKFARTAGRSESCKLVFAGTDPHLLLIQVNDDAPSVIHLPLRQSTSLIVPVYPVHFCCTDPLSPHRLNSSFI